MSKPKNDLMSLLFFLVGLLAVVDLVYVSVRQQANEEQAKERLECVVQVVEAAKSDQPLPDCEIRWND